MPEILNDCPVPDSEPPVNRRERAWIWRAYLGMLCAVAIYLIWG